MPHVLLVDDDPDHLLLFGHFLTTAGHYVHVAASADEATALALTRRFDAAVLDLRLPGDDGVELCQWLRLHPATAQLPILMLSADVSTPRIEAALDAGADGYLTKPARREELTTAVDRILTGSYHNTGVPAAHPAFSAVRGARLAVIA